MEFVGLFVPMKGMLTSNYPTSDITIYQTCIIVNTD
jgi:hypothetical protein